MMKLKNLAKNLQKIPKKTVETHKNSYKPFQNLSTTIFVVTDRFSSFGLTHLRSEVI
jgi:hypothetical protein